MAGKFLDHWCRQVMRSKIDPMKKVARTIRAHRPFCRAFLIAWIGLRHRDRILTCAA